MRCVSIARLRAAMASLFCSCAAGATPALPDGALEVPVCGAFKEWMAFSLWSRAAGRPDPQVASSLHNVSSVSYRTVDGRALRGFRIAAATSEKARGALLVAQGNAMLADQLLRPLSAFAQKGWEVYVFDYRGYGLSDGTPRLKAIVSDYQELAKDVSERAPGKLALYGMSFGGIVLLNALASIGAPAALVIDSSPSVISDMGCPADYDPVSKVPAPAGHLLMIVGEKDLVVPPSRTRALAEKINANGGRTERRAAWDHPFMDADSRIQSERLRLVADFLDSK